MRRPLGTDLRSIARAFAAVLITGAVLTPLAAVVGASLTAAGYWQFPPDALSFRWYIFFFSQPEYLSSVVVSVGIAAVVATIGIPVALAAAIGIAHAAAAARGPLANMALLPLLFPEIGLGLAIYIMYVTLHVPVSPVTLALAQLVVVLPFIIRLFLTGLRGVRPELEMAALNLGSSPADALRRVTLPLIKSSIVAAIVLAFVRSFDDVGIALFVNSPTTMPLAARLVLSADSERGPVLAVGGSLLLAVGIAVLVLTARTVGIDRALGLEKPRIVSEDQALTTETTNGRPEHGRDLHHGVDISEGGGQGVGPANAA